MTTPFSTAQRRLAAHDVENALFFSKMKSLKTSNIQYRCSQTLRALSVNETHPHAFQYLCLCFVTCAVNQARGAAAGRLPSQGRNHPKRAAGSTALRARGPKAARPHRASAGPALQAPGEKLLRARLSASSFPAIFGVP